MCSFFLKHFIYICVIFVSLSVLGQVPNWQWAKSSTGLNSENCNSVSTDINGNSYVTGFFYNSSITFGTYTLTNKGNYDFFIVKYDMAGNVLWAKSGGGIFDDVALSVTTDLSGNAYISGYYYSPTISVGSFSLTNNGVGDAFVVKYNSVGNELWTKSLGGNNDDRGNAIVTDKSGNVFVTGYFQSLTMIIDSYTLSNSGNNDVFISKFNNSGNLVWAKSFIGGGNEEGNGLASDSLQNIYLTGLFYSPVLSTGNSTIASAGSSDIFTVKLDNAGNDIWAKSAGGNLNDVGNAVNTDDVGNVYVTGNFISSTLSVGSTVLANSGNNDVILIKYDVMGNELWAKAAGGVLDDTGAGLVTDGNNGFYVTGHFHSPSITLGTYTLNNSGSGDGYVAKFNASGNVLSAIGMGGSADDGSNGVDIDPFGNVFVTGYFNSSSITFANYTLTNSGVADAFTAKLGSTVTSLIPTVLSEQDIRVYPNPSDGLFQMVSTKEKIYSIELFNELGICIKSKMDTGVLDFSLNISDYAPGIYFAKIYTEQHIIYSKLIKH